MEAMPSSSHKPVRRVKSGGVECNCEGWTYALIEEDPNQVKWYRPPNAKEQLGNRPALIKYWKQRRDRMPSFLNFRVKDAPEWLERVNDEEEENTKSISCGRSRESTKKGRSRDVGSSKYPHSCSAVTSPARITKVSTQPFPVSSPSSSTTMALTPASCNRGERRGAAAPEAGAGIAKGAAAFKRPPAGAAEQQGDSRGREQGGTTQMESGWPSQRRVEVKKKKALTRLPEAPTMSNPPLPLSRSDVDEHDGGVNSNNVARGQGGWQQGRGRQKPPEPLAIVKLDMVPFMQWIQLELNFKLQGKNRLVDPNTHGVKSLSELEQMVKSNPQLMCRYQAWIECHSESDAVSPPRLSGGKCGFSPALPSTSTPGAVYPRQIDSGMGREDDHESVGSSTVTEEKEDDSDNDLGFTQLDPGVVSATAAESEANRATGNDWFNMDDDNSDPQREDGVPIDEYALAGKGGGVQGDAVDDLGGGGADREDGPSSGEGGSVGREDAVAMDVVSSDDENSGGEWVGGEDTYDDYESGRDDETRTGSPAATIDALPQEHALPVRRVRRSLRGKESIESFPRVPEACTFLIEAWGFRYTRKGWTMVSEDGSTVLEPHEAPDYIVEQPVLSKEFESWSRRRDSQEDLASNSSGEKKEGDERNNDGEDGTQTEARTARKRSPAATPDRDVQRQSVEGQGMGGCDGEGDVTSDVIGNCDSENSDDTSSGDDDIGEGPINGGISDGDGDSDNDGNRSDHNASSQKRMTRGARNVRSREPKPSVPRLQHIWDFLRTEKNWEYCKVRGDHMVAGPDKNSVPMPQSQLQDFISEQPELLGECKDWLGEEAQNEEIPLTPDKPKRGRNSTSSPAPTRSRSRRRSVGSDQGLPEAKYAWEFVRENKRWGYHKDGIRIVGPEPEDLPIEYKELPHHIFTTPVLRREYNKWRRDLQWADDETKREQEKIKKEMAKERKRRARQRSVSESRKRSSEEEGEDESNEKEAEDESNEEEAEDESNEEAEDESNEDKGGDTGEDSDSESMDEEERRTLLMQNLRLEDVNRLYLWQFLSKEEGWTYGTGGLESAHIYFKKGTPRDAEVGLYIFRSLDEVRHRVQQDQDLRKRFYEYYHKDISARSIKPTGTRKRSHSCGDRGADSDAAAPSRKEKAARASVIAPVTAAPPSVGGGEPAMSSSPSGSTDVTRYALDASSRYARRTASGEEGLRGEGNKLSQQQQKLKGGAKAAAIAIPAASRVSKTFAAGGSKERGPGSDGGERKTVGAKRRAKPSRAAARSKRAGGDDECGGDSCETEFIEPPEIPGPKGGTCGVCLGPGSAEGSDLFLQCREHRCSSRVHKSCYPVDVRSIQDEFFRCNACAVSAAEPERRGCAICRRKQGMGGYAMISTKDGQFVHYLCFKKAVRGAENHQSFDKITRKFLAPDGVPQALALAAGRRLKPCRVCRRPGGVLKSCFRKNCKIRFHPLCGAVRVVEVLNAGGEETGFGAEMAILCETHVEQADKDCSTCGQPGTVGNMAACCRCDTHYHKACLCPPMEPEEESQGATAKVGWVCADCKSACASSMLNESDDDDTDDDGNVTELEQENDETEQPRNGPGQRHQRQATNKDNGKAISPAVPKKLANKHANGSSKKGRRDGIQRTRVKATKGGGRGLKKIAAERRRALEAMWSSCEEDDDGFGTSDGEGNSDGGMGAAAYAYPDKPRAEAFSAIPVGAQAYFNSHAGLKTLAVIPSGDMVATGGGGEGKGKGKATRVMVGRKRGWHARNRYSRAAKEDRLSGEKEGRKRAREDVELVGNGSGEEEEEDWEGAGGIAEAGVAGGFYGEAGEASMKKLLRLAQEPVRDQLDALMSKHAHSFPRWKSEMDWGWSPLFYGVGSKRELLQRLEDHVDQQGAAGGTVVGYDGFSANASVRGLLDSLCEEVLFSKSQVLSSASLRAYASNFAKAFASQQRHSVSRVARAEVAAPIVGCGGTRQGVHAHAGDSLARRSSVASGRAAQDGVDRFFEVDRRAVRRRLFIFVHNIDGEKLRNEESQAALAELAASPVIHLAASIDHVNAPLMWDVGLVEKFNWAWHKTHTYQPYIEELRNRRAWCAEEDEVLAMDRLAMVMKALTPRHVDVVVCLAKKLKGSPELGGKWVYRELLAKLKSNLSADTSQILDGLLVELTDHNVLVDEKSGNSRHLSIPGGPEVLDYLAGYQR